MALGIAGRLLSAAENELVWEAGRFVNKGPPEGSATLHEIAAAASADPLPGFGPTLVGTSFYRHPAINFPYGSHICVVDVDRGTGAVSIRRFVGVHGFAENTSPQPPWEEVYLPINKGLGPALYEAVVYDESGANLTSTYGDYLLTTAMDFPTWRPADPAEPRPYDNSQETNAAGEYPTVGAHAAIANAVADALWHLGVRHVDIPVTSARVWKLLRDHGVDG
jgi:carbon-monoxide dehydrogenase large subunit